MLLTRHVVRGSAGLGFVILEVHPFAALFTCASIKVFFSNV